jgi:MFS family permease
VEPRIRAIAVLSAVVFLVMLGLSIISPVLPFYAQELGASTFMVGLLVGALAGARLVVNLPAGAAGDRFGNWRMMQIGLLLITTTSFLAVVAFNYWMLLTVRIIEGVGSAFYVTSSLAALGRTAPPEKRGRYMGYYVSFLLLGQVLGPTVGGAVATVWGLRAPFAFYGIAALTGMFLLVFAKLPESKAEAATGGVDWVAVKGLIRNRSFIKVNFGTMSAFFVRSGILTTICPLFFFAKFGWNEATIGLLISVAAFCSLATMLPSGIWADRRGRKLPFTLSFVFTALVAPLFLWPSDFLGAVLVYALWGLAIGLQGPVAAWSTDFASKENMGTAMGLYRTMGDLGFLLGPTILTAIVGFGTFGQSYDLAYFFSMALMLVAAVVIVTADDPVSRNAKNKREKAIVPIE